MMLCNNEGLNEMLKNKKYPFFASELELSQYKLQYYCERQLYVVIFSILRGLRVGYTHKRGHNIKSKLYPQHKIQTQNPLIAYAEEYLIPLHSKYA